MQAEDCGPEQNSALNRSYTRTKPRGGRSVKARRYPEGTEGLWNTRNISKEAVRGLLL